MAATVAGRSPSSPSSLRRAILVHLRQLRTDLTRRTGLWPRASRTGVLQQLHALEDAGLVTHAAEKHGVGRPRHLYDVTPDAQELLPADYGGFAAGLLAAIESIGGEDLVEQVFAARRRQICDRLGAGWRSGSRTTRRSPRESGELATIQDEAATLPRRSSAPTAHSDSGSTTARSTTSPSGHRPPCEAELALFQELLGADVARESHIASGDRCCTYRIGSPTD